MVRRRWCAVVLAAILTVLVSPALPAQAADGSKPHLDSYIVTIVQPTAPDPSQIVACNNQVFNCGYVSVQTTFSQLDALSKATSGQLNTGDLQGTARLTRVYGCQTTKGRRLHRYDRKVVEHATLDTRFGFGFRLVADQQTLNVTTYDFLRDAQPGNCPAGTQATQYSIKVNHLVLDLVDLGTTPATQYHYRAPGSWTWSGAVATIPLSASAS